MRSVAPMRTAKIGYIVMSLLLCVMGALLVAFPNISIRTVGIFFGAVLIAFGVIKLVGYFSKDLFRLAFENDLASGILMIVLGGSLFFRTENALSFFCTVLGILILIDGLFKVQIAVEAKPFGITKWPLILLTAIITAVFGCILIIRPSESINIMTRFLGISLIIDGVLNIGTMITMVKIIRGQYSDKT